MFDLDGRFKRQFATPGKEPGQLGRPMNLTIRGHELYVAEYFNDRVQVFALDGTARRSSAKPGSGPSEFSAPGGGVRRRLRQPSHRKTAAWQIAFAARRAEAQFDLRGSSS
ncbi:MAG: hypothetical protein ACT4PS_16420 [Betaproteobacteria bacterium]